MGKKYIIELPDDVKQVAWPMKDTGDIKVKYVGDLKPLPSYVVSYVASATRESYNDGLNTAWNLVKQLLSDEFDCVELKQIFDTSYLGDIGEILNRYSPLEVSEKITEYKKRKEIEDQEIKVGDEVECGELSPLIVTWTNLGCATGVFLESGGTPSRTLELKECKKTGRHFPEIAKLFGGNKKCD